MILLLDFLELLKVTRSVLALKAFPIRIEVVCALKAHHYDFIILLELDQLLQVIHAVINYVPGVGAVGLLIHILVRRRHRVHYMCFF